MSAYPHTTPNAHKCNCIADFTLKSIEWDDTALYQQTQALKAKNPNLKTLIAIGGWTMNTPGSGYETLFSQAVSTPANRSKLISGMLAFTQQWGFDG